MATGDPLYCYEHKCFINACGQGKHKWETDKSFTARREAETRPAHPECPSCRCTQPFTEVSGWR